MTRSAARNAALSIEQLEEMVSAISKRSDVLRDEGALLSDRLESLSEQSEAAILNAKHIQEAISTRHAAQAE